MKNNLTITKRIKCFETYIEIFLQGTINQKKEFYTMKPMIQE